MFRSFCSEKVAGVDAVKTCSFYKKNEPLFLEGTKPRGVFFISRGKVKVFALGEQGKEQIIQIPGEGDLVGFRAMFNQELYKVSATALEDCNICFIGKEDFLQLVDENEPLKNGIMKALAAELAERATFVTKMAQKSVRQRLAYSLLILEKVYKGDPINLSREDLANFVGTATETVIRLLKEYKLQNLVKTKGRKIVIIDRGSLSKVAGFT
jgi:CRP/FNR family transcriptional regulator